MPQIRIGHYGVVIRTVRSITFFVILLNSLFDISVFYVIHFRLLVLFSVVTSETVAPSVEGCVLMSEITRRVCYKTTACAEHNYWSFCPSLT